MSKITSRWADSTIVKTAQIDQPNGVAGLDGSGKLSTSVLPASSMEFKGAWNANTNSPSLADGTGNAGDTYRVSVAGSQDLGSGSISFAIGDLVIYSGSVWQKTPADSSFLGKDTDDLSEGTTNLYFTENRVLNTILDGFTDADDSAVTDTDSVIDGIGKLQGQINALTSVSFAEEVFTLSAGDITNGFVTLANTPIVASMVVFPDDGPVQRVTSDYTVAGAVVTFAGDLATTLAASDVLIIKYAY
jgi:hypothetical protein